MRPQGPGMPGPQPAGNRPITGKPRAGHVRPLQCSNNRLDNQMPDNKTPKYQYDHYDFGDMLDSAVEAGSKIGSSVLGSIADALAQAGDAHEQAAARQLRRMEAPSGAQMEKRRPVCRRCADGGRLDLYRLLWHRGACAGHPDGSRRRAAGAFPTGFHSPADSDSRVFTPQRSASSLWPSWH